uniref:Ig-like domain-containing protein n=1 Tax=Rodentolepis nana TaxID=102285 RepID=A0A0R3TY40_RODNA
LPLVACNYTTRLEEIKSHIANGSPLIDGEECVVFNSNLTPFWEFFSNQLSAEILPKVSNLEMSLRHTPPVLCNEKYTILCHVLNTEDRDITDLTISAMLAGGGTNDPTLEVAATPLDAPQRLGSVAVGQMASRNLNPTSSSGEDLFSQVLIASTISQGADLVCPISVHCPKFAGDRSLRVDAHYDMLAHLPSPGVNVFSWRSNGSICLVYSGNNTEAPSSLTLTRCVQSKRVQLSVIPPFEVASRILSLKHEAITTVVTGKPFILEVSLTNCSPWPINVENSHFNFVCLY